MLSNNHQVALVQGSDDKSMTNTVLHFFKSMAFNSITKPEPVGILKSKSGI